MTSDEVRAAIMRAGQRADVKISDFAFFDEARSTGIRFDGTTWGISAGQTVMVVFESEHGRKVGVLGGLEKVSPDRLETMTYNFAVDWIEAFPPGATGKYIDA